MGLHTLILSVLLYNDFGSLFKVEPRRILLHGARRDRFPGCAPTWEYVLAVGGILHMRLEVVAPSEVASFPFTAADVTRIMDLQERLFGTVE